MNIDKYESHPLPSNCLFKLQKFLQKYGCVIYNLDRKVYHTLDYSATNGSFYLVDTHHNDSLKRERFRISKIELDVAKYSGDVRFRVVLTDHVHSIKNGYVNYTPIEIVSMKNVSDLFDDNMSHYEICDLINDLKLRIVPLDRHIRHTKVGYITTRIPQNVNRCEIYYSFHGNINVEKIKDIKLGYKMLHFETETTEISSFVYRVVNMDAKFLDDFCEFLPNPGLCDLNRKSLHTKFYILQELIGDPNKDYVRFFAKTSDLHPGLKERHQLSKLENGLLKLENSKSEVTTVTQLTFYRNFVRCYSENFKTWYEFSIETTSKLTDIKEELRKRYDDQRNYYQTGKDSIKICMELSSK